MAISDYIDEYIAKLPPKRLQGLYTYAEWKEFEKRIEQARSCGVCPEISWICCVCLCGSVRWATKPCRRQAEYAVMEQENERLAHFGIQWIYKYRVLVWTSERREYEQLNPKARKLTEETTPWPSKESILAKRQEERAERLARMSGAMSSNPVVNPQSNPTPPVLPIMVSTQPTPQYDYIQTMDEPGITVAALANFETNSSVEGSPPGGVVIPTVRKKRFCGRCGARSDDEMDVFCQECGHKIAN